MNNNHSGLELNYKRRWLTELLQEGVKSHPVIVITGARQVGKSTLLQSEEPFCRWQYLSMDDFDLLYHAKHHPSALWSGTDKVILDEVQKSPNLLEAVKIEVDSRRRNVRFILSGSANLLLMKRVSETLAGRAVYYTLYPMAIGEIEGTPRPNILEQLISGNIPEEKKLDFKKENIFSIIGKGFMPPLMELEGNSVISWWEGYVATYLERDLRQLSQIDSLPDFRCFMQILALQSAQVLNQTTIARDTGISQPTIHRYINLLETTYLVERIPAFTRNRRKRLIKSPKILWVDPGLVVFLIGYYNLEKLKDAREIGSIFETLIFLHLKVLSQFLIPQGRFYYWRTVNGEEVDLVLEWGRHLLAFEIKLKDVVTFSDAENLHLFLQEYPETSLCIIIYSGNEIKRLDEKIIALPWRIFG